jgi:3'-phosphoadenosine 5'-phosphosulfate sulfotransferase (PAPS reductase)/FAD synthetase
LKPVENQRRELPLMPPYTDGKAKRLVDHWRPVLHWPEQAVWDILRRHGVDPHPAYHAGFGRLSCRTCVFASDAQWATLACHDPAGTHAIAAYERRFGRTICRSQRSVLERAAKAQPFAAATPERMRLALADQYHGPIHVGSDAWRLPAGAFAGHAGPT